MIAESGTREDVGGRVVRASDPEFVAMRLEARRLTRIFNSAREDEAEKRIQVLQELFGHLGLGVEIEPPFRCDYGRHIHAGERLYMNVECAILDYAEVHIGRRSSGQTSIMVTRPLPSAFQYVIMKSAALLHPLFKEREALLCRRPQEASTRCSSD